MDKERAMENLLDKYDPKIPKSQKAVLSSTLDIDPIEILAESAHANVLSLPDKVGYDKKFREKCRKTVTDLKKQGYPVIESAEVEDIGLLGMNSIIKVSGNDPRDVPLGKFGVFSCLSFFDSSSIPIPQELQPDFSALWNRYHNAHIFLFESLYELAKCTQTGRHVIAKFYIKSRAEPVVVQERVDKGDFKKTYVNTINLLNPVLEIMGCTRTESVLFIEDSTNAELVVVARKTRDVESGTVFAAMGKLEKKIDDPSYA